MNKRKRIAQYPVNLTARISEDQARQLYSIADKFHVPVSELIREMIGNELPKLNQRYKKRISRGQLRENADVA